MEKRSYLRYKPGVFVPVSMYSVDGVVSEGELVDFSVGGAKALFAPCKALDHVLQAPLTIRIDAQDLQLASPVFESKVEVVHSSLVRDGIEVGVRFPCVDEFHMEGAMHLLDALMLTQSGGGVVIKEDDQGRLTAYVVANLDEIVAAELERVIANTPVSDINLVACLQISKKGERALEQASQQAIRIHGHEKVDAPLSGRVGQ